MLNNMIASNEWAYRPDEERFESTPALKSHLERLGIYTRDVVRDLKSLYWNLDDSGQPRLGTPDDLKSGAYMSNWAFDQMSSMMKVPADYLRSLKDTNTKLLLDNLNHGLNSVESGDKRLLARLDGNGGAIIRAINGKNFARVMDLDLVDRIIEIEKRGWRVPPARPSSQSVRGIRPATEADCLRNRGFGLSVKPGDMIAPAGTYYGDRSSFYIRVNENSEDGLEIGGQQLLRMLIIQNSEVGAGYWQVYMAYLMGICGNHILHGIQNLREMKIRHVGAAESRINLAFTPDIVEYGRDSRLADEESFLRARQKLLGPGKVEVVETLFDKRIAPRKTLEAAWVKAEEHEGWYGAPNTAWGFSMGLTEVSQEQRWQDKRHEIDEAAAKVLKMAA